MIFVFQIVSHYFCQSNQDSTEQYRYNKMELKFNNQETKVQQLTDYIEAAISHQSLKVGDKLPSINALSNKHNVSRDTVFKALYKLKEKGLIDSIHGKNYFVANQSPNILLLLDRFSPFKEALYYSLINKLPDNYKTDLWFHQYNKKLFDTIIDASKGRYSKYIVMNYDNEILSDKLAALPKDNVMLIDFGKFDKNGYSYVCQDFDEYFYNALLSIKEDLLKYNKLVFVLSTKHQHPQSSREYFIKFCTDHHIEYEIANDASSNIRRNCCYIVIKQTDVVELIKQSNEEKMVMGTDFGLIAYNENPFYEIIGTGVSSMGINWKEMGAKAADFILTGNKIQTYLNTIVNKRESF